MEDPTSPLWITALNFVGAVNTLLLMLVLLALPSARRSVAARHLIVLLGLVGLVSLMVTLQHARLFSWTPWREIFEQSLTLLAGPVFLGYTVRSLTGRSAPAWIYAPVVIHAVAALIVGKDLVQLVRMQDLVWLQMAYSTVAAFLILRSWLVEPQQREGREHLLLFLCLLIVLHAGQLVRTLRPGDPVFLNIVPLTLTFALATLLIYAVIRLRAMLILGREPLGGEADQEDREIADLIEAKMREARLYTDPNLSVEDVGTHIGIAPVRVSRAVNRCLGVNMPTYINNRRLDEAERLLADPDERRYTVEGIGRQAGFGSRTSFYRAFRERHDESPASYRARGFPKE